MRIPGIRALVATSLLSLSAALAPLHAEKRVALVIGNQRYANLAPIEQLENPVNDARAIGTALTRLGFEVVTRENLGRRALLAEIDNVARRLSPGDTVFFFFSGHGFAVESANYILPVDVPAAGGPASQTGAAIKEEDISAAFQRMGAGVTVMVLDACRSNPFAKGPGANKGLLPHDPPTGVFTLYSARRGQVALDRLYAGDRDPNSVFTRVLLQALAHPEGDLLAVARQVREEVRRLARSEKYDQLPAFYDETSGDPFYLVPPSANNRPQAGPLPADPRPATPPLQTAVVRPPIVKPVAPAPSLCGDGATVSASRKPAPLSADEECSLKPKDIFKECDDCPEMVVVPAGSNMIGSPDDELGRSDTEGPRHLVTIAKQFAVGMFPVKRGQFNAFVKQTAGYRAGGSACAGKDEDPICLNLFDTEVYLSWLTEKTRKPYRLLSEAEWEYAARGRTEPGADALAFAWRRLEVNDFGLHGMLGVAWQWTMDCWHGNYKGAPADGSAWRDAGNCAYRMLRGGSGDQDSSQLRAAMRSYSVFDKREEYHGFRIARTLTP